MLLRSRESVIIQGILERHQDDPYSTDQPLPATPTDIASFVVAVILRASVIICCILMIFLCLFKRNRQPLKSRKWIPYVFLLSKIIGNIAGVQSAWPASWSHDSIGTASSVGCFIEQWGSNPLYIVNLLCIVFLFGRFFVLKAYESRKQQHQEIRREEQLADDCATLDTDKMKEQSAIGRANRRIRLKSKIIKSLTSWYLLAFSMVALLLSIYIMGAIDISRTGGICNDNWAKITPAGVPAAILARYEIVLVVVIAVTAVIMLITDMVMVYRTPSPFSFGNMFLEDDPLRYRMELYLFCIPASCLGIIVACFGISSTVVDRTSTIVLVRTILYFLFWEIPGLLVIPGVSLFHAIAWERREKKAIIKSNSDRIDTSPGNNSSSLSAISGLPKHVCELDPTEFNDSSDMIHRLLGCGDVTTHELFRDFAKKEFSVENVLIYDDIARFKNNVNVERYEQAKLIFDSYLASGSLNQVNLPSKSADSAAEKLKAYEEDKEGCTLGDDLFDGVLQQVVVNLRDTYMRLWYTQAFKEYVEKRKGL
ncbi:7 TM domain-containing transmembrane protein [Acrasis kona]|uniref:7 TM domain-containing transmembrane protein n=1 Tax=Acrasis kona TaxID=1008807 RepID=A0AAW2Z1P8_9EUKA